LAYAVLDNIDQEEADFLLQHEGIDALVYDSTDGDYSGFDRYLGGIHQRTAPIQIIGRLLQDKKLLWLDPNPDNNLYGKQLISKSTGNGCELVPCEDPMTALLSRAERNCTTRAEENCTTERRGVWCRNALSSSGVRGDCRASDRIVKNGQGAGGHQTLRINGR